MDVKVAEPSRTLNIVLNKEEFIRFLKDGRISLDVHREGINGYIQFIHITQEGV